METSLVYCLTKFPRKTLCRPPVPLYPCTLEGLTVFDQPKLPFWPLILSSDRTLCRPPRSRARTPVPLYPCTLEELNLLDQSNDLKLPYWPLILISAKTLCRPPLYPCTPVLWRDLSSLSVTSHCNIFYTESTDPSDGHFGPVLNSLIGQNLLHWMQYHSLLGVPSISIIYTLHQASPFGLNKPLCPRHEGAC